MKPLEITTLEDAVAALGRSKGSFEEWLDCARIFAANRKWEKLEIAALKAMESATNRTIRPILLKEAAERFAAGSLKNISSEAEFKDNCKKTISILKDFSQSFKKSSDHRKTHFDTVLKELDDILILLADNSPGALVQIASKLRKGIGRPDLSIKVATAALMQNPMQFAAYTTRGSAYTEIELFENALSDFLIAEKDAKSRSFAIAGHTKLLILQGNFQHALEIGSELLKKKHSRPVLYMLAAAAKGSGDEIKFNWLVNEAESLPEVLPGAGKILLMRKSIEILLENKQFDVAEVLLNQLAEIDKPSRIKTLANKIVKAKFTNAKYVHK
jgi:tetratricopeptide (TPR) repeat protein